MDPIVVIGAGAAGIMAARRAAELGADVLLIEKTPRLGTKILISGGGKCNITHDGPIEEVLKSFRQNEARFIRPSCYRFTNRQIVDVLTNRGLSVYTRPDGRIFPVDQTAKDVVEILRRYLAEVGVRIKYNTAVKSIRAGSDGVCGAELPSSFQPSRHIILAVGGSSYPNSGTTGDGFRMAKALGHKIVQIRAALAPIKLKGDRWTPFSGVALRDCLLKARANNKEVARWRGDMLFTRHGISGPSTLEISRNVSEARERGPVSIEVDLLPDTNFEQLSSSVLDYSTTHPSRLVATFLEGTVPERLVSEFLASVGLNGTTRFSQFTKSQRVRLVTGLKAFELGLVKEVILDKGEVVAGGVTLDEVDPQTMRSKLIKGLYLCGEVLDIAGPVGGYNLQAAFATGYVAGDTASKDFESFKAAS